MEIFIGENLRMDHLMGLENIIGKMGKIIKGFSRMINRMV